MPTIFTPDDHRKLGEPMPLFAHDLWPIPNFRLKPLSPEMVRATVIAHSASHSIEVRSERPFYNCVGLPFSARRTAIDPDVLPDLLQHDGFRQIPINELRTGDLILYTRSTGYSHVAVVLDVHRELGLNVRHIDVASKWGNAPEYFHKAGDVPLDLCGEPTEFWTGRTK
jgi:hypothetical protein